MFVVDFAALVRAGLLKTQPLKTPEFAYKLFAKQNDPNHELYPVFLYSVS